MYMSCTKIKSSIITGAKLLRLANHNANNRMYYGTLTARLCSWIKSRIGKSLVWGEKIVGAATIVVEFRVKNSWEQ